MSHYKSDGGDLRVARYVGSGGSGCASSQWTCTTVDTNNDTGHFSSIAFDPQGSATVAYYDNWDEAVRTARFVGANGTGCATNTWSCTTVDTAGDTGKFPSVAFDQTGKRWISYFDNTNSDLRVSNAARSGELKLINSSTANNGDAITESHVDMGAVTDMANRDDADCITNGKTWSNGKWFEGDSLSGVTLNTNACTEVAFAIDASNTTVGTSYRFAVATDDSFRKDKGLWRGPIATSASPTVTVSAPQPNIPPTANFAANPTTGTVPLNVNFDASGSADPDGTITSYAWNFGDGQTGSGQSTQHTYTTAGTFVATLTVTDDDNATVTTTHNIVTTAPAPASAIANVGECKPRLRLSVDGSPAAVTEGGSVTYASTVRNDPTGPCLGVAGDDRLDGSITLTAPGPAWSLSDVTMWLERPGPSGAPSMVLPTSSNRTTAGTAAPTTCPGQVATGCSSDQQFISGPVNYPKGPSIPVTQPIEVPAGGTIELPFTFFPKFDTADITDLSQNPTVTLALAVTDENGSIIVSRTNVTFSQAPTATATTVQITFADETNASLAVGDIAPGAQASPAPFVYTPTATDDDAIRATVTASGTGTTLPSDLHTVTTVVILNSSSRSIVNPTASPDIVHQNTATMVFFAVSPTEAPTSTIQLSDDLGTVIGELRDDGTNGDLVAGDGSYGVNQLINNASTRTYGVSATTASGAVHGDVTVTAAPAGEPINVAPSNVNDTFVNPADGAKVIRTQILLFLDDTGTHADATAAASSVSGTVIGRLDKTSWQLQVPTMNNTTDLQQVLQQLAGSAHVVGAEPNTVSESTSVEPNDPYYFYQWHLETSRPNESSTPSAHADQAWTFARGGSSPTVAVLDSGVNLQHEDLQGRLLAGHDFVNDDDDADDDNGHGTHVAGVIGATPNNNTGLSGVVWGTSILPVKVMNEEGEGDVAQSSEGIRWAVDHGAQIINMSLSGESRTETEAKAIDYAWDRNRLVVAAAGNDNCDDREYPAGFNRTEKFSSWFGINDRTYDTELLAVGASDETNNRSIWQEEHRYDTCVDDVGSNWGSWVDVAAPGTNIWSTSFDPGSPSNGGPAAYSSADGTSSATPVASGVAALVWGQDKKLSPGDVKARLMNTATPLNPGSDVGTGAINAYAATFNGGFESGFDGWQTTGTTSTIANLGPITPRSGQKMGQISNGPGGAVVTSSVAKSFGIDPVALVDGELKLSFQYNFISEEYPEYVGSSYNDDFVAQIRTSNGTIFNLATESVNGTTFTPVSGIDFPGGDSTAGQSGWKTASIDIPVSALAGSTGLELIISDQGDAVYDSVVLIDDFIVR